MCLPLGIGPAPNDSDGPSNIRPHLPAPARTRPHDLNFQFPGEEIKVPHENSDTESRRYAAPMGVRNTIYVGNSEPSYFL
jgi:hypothetical protein